MSFELIHQLHQIKTALFKSINMENNCSINIFLKQIHLEGCRNYRLLWFSFYLSVFTFIFFICLVGLYFMSWAFRRYRYAAWILRAFKRQSVSRDFYEKNRRCSQETLPQKRYSAAMSNFPLGANFVERRSTANRNPKQLTGSKTILRYWREVFSVT